MKIRADNKRKELEFKEGDFVYVKLQPYRQHSVVLRKNKKLSMKDFGLFPILQHIGKVAYKLQLPSTAHIHPVFHISVLKKCEDTPAQANVPTPLSLDEKGCRLYPHIVLGHRVIKK